MSQYDFSFEEAVELAEQESVRVTASGFKGLFDIFEHLSDGGTVDNHPEWTRDEIVCILASATLSVADELVDRAPVA